MLHPPRRINNVYFDNVSLSDFMHTVNGEKKRRKVRLRWYGDTFSEEVVAPQLEIKIKNDQSNTKLISKLDSGDSTRLKEWIKNLALNNSPHAKESLSDRQPTLLNSYYRHYYGSRDGNFRLTIDLDMSYQALSRHGKPLGKPLPEDNRSIIELKYNISQQNIVSSISSSLPFRLTRNSKYRNGIVQLMQNGYL